MNNEWVRVYVSFGRTFKFTFVTLISRETVTLPGYHRHSIYFLNVFPRIDFDKYFHTHINFMIEKI